LHTAWAEQSGGADAAGGGVVPAACVLAAYAKHAITKMNANLGWELVLDRGAAFDAPRRHGGHRP
jgi:hypothetical protein